MPFKFYKQLLDFGSFLVIPNYYQWCRKVKNFGGPVVIEGDNLPSPVGIGLSDLPNIEGGGQWPPWPFWFRHHWYLIMNTSISIILLLRSYEIHAINPIHVPKVPRRLSKVVNSFFKTQFFPWFYRNVAMAVEKNMLESFCCQKSPNQEISLGRFWE